MPSGVFNRIKKGSYITCSICKTIFYVCPYRLNGVYPVKYCSKECLIKSGNLTRKGTKNDSLHRKRISERSLQRVELGTHNLWKGGITTGRALIYNSKKYKQWRESVFKRDKYLCVIGGKEHGNRLEAHHIKPFSKFPKLRFSIRNGMTLCKQCHQKTDTYGGKVIHYKLN